MKFGTKVASWMRMMPNFECMYNAEKACNTTLDNENKSQQDMRYIDGAL